MVPGGCAGAGWISTGGWVNLNPAFDISVFTVSALRSDTEEPGAFTSASGSITTCR